MRAPKRGRFCIISAWNGRISGSFLVPFGVVSEDEVCATLAGWGEAVFPPSIHGAD